MGRISKKLSALEVSRISKPGKHPIGESLYLQISNNGTKSWLFRYSLNGKTTWMGLGSSKIISLAEARSKVSDYQKDLTNGLNPLAKKVAFAKEQELQDAKKVTFEDCAKRYIESHSPGWKNKKHKDQWITTLETYAFPVIGSLSVQNIDTALVLKILEPIWFKKTETASRLRGRIERILSWAAVRGYRGGENPARWKGHLDQLLPQRGDVQKVKHFKALSFSEISEFMQKLRTLKDVAALALEFVVLTATRTNETLGARWSEINIEEKYWLIPAERMKAKKEHKVPLSPRALEVLEYMKSISVGEYIFPGRKPGRPLSDMALIMILRKLNLNVTTHGFRSTFSDWAAERTNFPREVVEMALAHTIKNKVEAAYRRGDSFLKRQKLMSTWAAYCSAHSVNCKVLDIQDQKLVSQA